MSAVRAIRASILTHQMRRSLRVWGLANAQFAADRAAGFAPVTTFDQLAAHEREAYLAAAEGEIASPPPIPRRDRTIGRDQVTRRERARLLAFGGRS